MQSTKGTREKRKTGRSYTVKPYQREKRKTGQSYTVKSYQNFRQRWFGWIGHRKVQRQVKDRLFRFLFEKDKEALLELYNALNGTDYQDTSGLQVVTIENAVYVVMKNDLAFVLAGTLNLYEHQSTYNPNMPVRFLIYLAEEYQKLLEQVEQSIYGTKQITLPTPQCIVFYNGEREMPEEKILSLSDAFEAQKVRASVELKVRMLNIHHGKNRELMEKCRVLEEYSLFVESARQYIADGREHQTALNLAIDYCIDHDILSEFLQSHRAEVLGMLLEEFDVDKYERSIREEGREEGREQGREEGLEEGREQGREEGIEQGTERAFQLMRKLSEQNRMEDVKRATEEPEYRERLFREFGL